MSEPPSSSAAQPTWWSSGKGPQSDAPGGPISLRLDRGGKVLSRVTARLPHVGETTLEPGADLGDLIGEEAAGLVRDRAAACISLGMHMHGIVEAPIGGQSRRLLVTLAPRFDGPTHPWCSVSVRDVTGLPSVSAERPAWHATLALASGIAHRFNNLLVAITGNAGLLRSALPPEHPEQAAIQDMEQAAREMTDLTRYLLAFAGEGRYAPRPVSINRLAERALDAIDEQEWPNVHFVRTLAPSLPPVEADPAQIEQAVYNLVINALEALPEGRGTIQVSTSLSGSEPTVVLSVTDDGVGMSDEIRARIFEPFFTTRTPGRGLGLAAVIGIARGHRGSVRVHSEPGAGSTFELHLPRPEKPSVAPKVPGRTASGDDKGAVLVIDDDPGTVRVMQRMLRTLGYEVMTAQDGESALRVAGQHRARLSLCISDMALPDTTGERLCAQLKELIPGVRVMVCSGYSDEQSQQQAVTAGADGFLGKPFKPEELAESVRRLMGR